MSLRSLVISRFPPEILNGGAAIRNNQNIYALAQLGPTDVITICEKPKQSFSKILLNNVTFPRVKSAQRGIKEKIKFGILKGSPFHEPSFFPYLSADVTTWIKNQGKINQYDVALVEELSLASYLPLLRTVARTVVFDAHNVESPLRNNIDKSIQSKKTIFSKLFKKRRIYFEEKRACKQSHKIWTCSDTDTALIKKTYGPNLCVSTIPNAINLDLYRGPEEIAQSETWQNHKVTVTYLGSYSYPPNSEAALILIREVMPILRKLADSPKLVLVGRDPTLEMIEAAKNSSDILVTGAVPSTQPFLTIPTVIALPIQLGSGTRLKILEAFAAGRPVVSSAKGAEGIEAKNEDQILIRETPEDFAEAILDVWLNDKKRQNILKSAYNLVKKKYSWEHVTKLVESQLQ